MFCAILVFCIGTAAAQTKTAWPVKAVSDKSREASDAASRTSAIKTYGTVYNSGSLYQLQVKKDVLLQGVTSLYIGNAYHAFLKASKKNFHLLFGKKNISIFTQEHKTNFNKAEDLKALLLFCVQ